MTKLRFVYYGPEGIYCSDIIPKEKNWMEYGHLIFKEFYNVHDISDFTIVVENFYQDFTTGESASIHRYNESMPESSIQSLCSSMDNSPFWGGIYVNMVSAMPDDMVLADATGKKFTFFPQMGVALLNGKYI